MTKTTLSASKIEELAKEVENKFGLCDFIQIKIGQ